MNKTDCIIVTGAAGFIGACTVAYLNQKGYTNLILVDDFSVDKKRANWQHKQFQITVPRDNFFVWLDANKPRITAIIHLGARTDTTEFDYTIHEKLNVMYSQNIWKYCTKHAVPLIYASSAATYGAGELGYNDSHDIVEKLHPLNPYGVSKNEFDKWALQQKQQPPHWFGLKFFNIYGPNETHKERMASVIFHAFNQIKTTGIVKLFRSHKEGFDDGEQLRDFVYVKDLTKVMLWMLENLSQPTLLSGLYNLGTGKARSFYDLARATYKGLDLEPNIQFVDMPMDIRDKYQYFTEAKMQKLYNAGYTNDFYSLENGVADYVRNYLAKGMRL